MTGGRISLLRDAFGDRSVRLVVGLSLAALIPIAALAYVQWAALRALDSTTADTLEAVSLHTADVIAATIARDFAQPSFDIERVDHSALARNDLARVADGLLAVRRPSLVDLYYVWGGQAGDALGHTVLQVSPRALVEARQPGDVFVPAGPVGLSLLQRASRIAVRRQLWDSWRETLDGRSYIFVLHLLFESPARRRLTSFIGFRVDVGSLRERYLPPVVEATIGAQWSPSDLARLEVSLLDAEGKTFFRSSPAAIPPWVTELAIPLRFFDPDIMPADQSRDDGPGAWRLMTSYGGKSVAELARDRSSGQRELLAVLVGFACLALVLAAWSAVTQVRLAEAKAQFVATVSHDLKTPLALIRLFAETLELGRVTSPERTQEYFRIINREATKLAELIETLLRFPRIDAGLRMFNLAPLDLGDAVRTSVERFRPWFEDAGFTVSVDVAPVLPTVLADEEAVHLAVGNLLSNAVNYSGDSRQIEVRVTPKGDNVVVEVEDHGIGIPRRFHKRIFRRYYRVREQPVPSSVGTGLGLAIVRRVMAAHRGSVRVTSEPGRGSTFALAFPIGKE